MAFLAFLLALGALIWALRNSGAVKELKADQLRLQREFARLSDKLTKAISSQGTVAQEPAPKPAPPPGPPPLETKPPVTPASPIPSAHPAPPRQHQPVPPAPKPQPVVSPPAPRTAPKPAFDWESLVGVKLFSWVAGIALSFAAIFFLKYSVDQGWLGPQMRVTIGLVTGISLLLLCEWKAARRYAITANALDGAGIAILFATFYAAHSLWHLIGPTTAFAMMALLTVVAVLLSLYHESVIVALMGLVGGFATPALLSTSENRPIALFGYLLLLNAGLAWVAYRKRWPHLTVLSAVFTTRLSVGMGHQVHAAGHSAAGIDDLHGLSCADADCADFWREGNRSGQAQRVVPPDICSKRTFTDVVHGVHGIDAELWKPALVPLRVSPSAGRWPGRYRRETRPGDPAPGRRDGNVGHALGMAAGLLYKHGVARCPGHRFCLRRFLSCCRVPGAIQGSRRERRAGSAVVDGGVSGAREYRACDVEPRTTLYGFVYFDCCSRCLLRTAS